MPDAQITAGRARVFIRLKEARRRFAFTLAGLRMAIGVPGSFRQGRSSENGTVIRLPGLTVVVRYMEAHAAVRAFRRGELDEAPVPQGEIRALEADPTLRAALRTRQLLGVDAIILERSIPRKVRQVYWLTAPRGEYQALIPEVAPAAYGLLPDAERPTPAEVRRARLLIGALPRVRVRLAVAAVGSHPELREAAELAWAEWRQLGLPVEWGSLGGGASFARIISPYPHPEGLFTSFGYKPEASLTRLDERLRREARVIPLAYLSEARLVNPRVRGWAMDELGGVDYTRVTLAR